MNRLGWEVIGEWHRLPLLRDARLDAAEVRALMGGQIVRADQERIEVVAPSGTVIEYHTSRMLTLERPTGTLVAAGELIATIAGSWTATWVDVREQTLPGRPPAALDWPQLLRGNSRSTVDRDPWTFDRPSEGAPEPDRGQVVVETPRASRPTTTLLQLPALDDVPAAIVPEIAEPVAVVPEAAPAAPASLVPEFEPTVRSHTVRPLADSDLPTALIPFDEVDD